MRPQQVEAYMQGTTIDSGRRGYDECFGHGRVDALRAVKPPCPEEEEQPNG